jgi:hypothetical protein
VVKEVGVGAVDLGGDRLQGDRLRPQFQQKLTRRGKGGGATFFRREAGPSY